MTWRARRYTDYGIDWGTFTAVVMLHRLSPRSICNPKQLCARCTVCHAERCPNILYTINAAPRHCSSSHPESPSRLDAIEAALRSAIMVQQESCGLLTRLPSSMAPGMDELAAVHRMPYLLKLQQLSASLEGPTMLDDSTYLAPGSFEAVAEVRSQLILSETPRAFYALEMSVGATLQLLDAMLQPAADPCQVTSCSGPTPSLAVNSRLQNQQQKQQQQQQQRSNQADSTPAAPAAPPPAPAQRAHPTGFALVRPPGHHVLPSRPMGFGLLNIVSLAAKHAQQVHQLQRVMIFDFDAHHGNGTMEVFYQDPSVLYISTHQAGLWPYTGKVTNTGEGAGNGTTINIPLPGGSGDAAMKMVMQEVVWPAAKRFAPDLILVSAGYDSHWQDPLAGFQFRTATYHWLGAQLQAMADQLCYSRVVFVLEGGYNLDSLGASVAATALGCMGLPFTDDATDLRMLHEEPLTKVEAVVAQVKRLHGL